MSAAELKTTIRVSGARDVQAGCSDLSDRLVIGLSLDPEARQRARRRLYRRAALNLAEFYAAERAARLVRWDPRRLVDLAAERACLRVADRLKSGVPTA